MPSLVPKAVFLSPDGAVMGWNDRPGQFVEPGRKARG